MGVRAGLSGVSGDQSSYAVIQRRGDDVHEQHELVLPNRGGPSGTKTLAHKSSFLELLCAAAASSRSHNQAAHACIPSAQNWCEATAQKYSSEPKNAVHPIALLWPRDPTDSV